MFRVAALVDEVPPQIHAWYCCMVHGVLKNVARTRCVCHTNVVPTTDYGSPLSGVDCVTGWWSCV